LVSIPSEEDLIGAAHKRADGRYVLASGAVEKMLTIDGPLQEKLEHLLRSYQTPFGALVAIDPSTGRILAMAEHAEQAPQIRGLTTRAVFPAASIFKIVTAAALLEAGLKPEDQECSHGGKRRISAQLLTESSQDRACYSLATALARSANAIFAKLTYKHLSAEKLKESAHAFYFNRPIEFPIPTDVSLAAIPLDALGLATTGSGFGDVYLSPLHGAAIAASRARPSRSESSPRRTPARSRTCWRIPCEWARRAGSSTSVAFGSSMRWERPARWQIAIRFAITPGSSATRQKPTPRSPCLPWW
jgi:hypothetical protein